MTGFRSKRQMSEIRWLGPYAPEDRHADTVTLDHLIELRKRLAEVERQRDNALDMVMSLKKEVDRLNQERMEAAHCIEGLIELVSVLAAENEQLKAEECPCKRREAELDMLFSEWNEEK